MSTISDANNYNVFTDAQQFVSQWENDEWAIDEEKGKTYTMRTPQGNVETIAHFLAGLIANFKQATTAANLWIKFGKNDLHPEVTMTEVEMQRGVGHRIKDRRELRDGIEAAGNVFQHDAHS